MYEPKNITEHKRNHTIFFIFMRHKFNELHNVKFFRIFENKDNICLLLDSRNNVQQLRGFIFSANFI